MTRSRHTQASLTDLSPPADERPERTGADEAAGSGSDRDEAARPETVPVEIGPDETVLDDLARTDRRREEIDVDETGLDEASRRAWTRAMTVRPFGDAYLVDCAGDTRYVSLDPSTCSCGAASTDDPCEHVRRVAIEINLGRVPPPSERTVECEECSRAVAVSAADSPPALCPECHLEPGDLVVDVDGDEETPLLVVSRPGRPADLVRVPDDGRTVARYPANDAYPPDTPVVEVVYPQAVSTDRSPRRYLFPLARLRRPDGDPRPPESDDDSSDFDDDSPDSDDDSPDSDDRRSNASGRDPAAHAERSDTGDAAATQ